MPEGVGGWGDPMNWGIWLWLNPLDPENFEVRRRRRQGR